MTVEDVDLKIECLEDFTITKLADFQKDLHAMRTAHNKRLDDLEKEIIDEILNCKSQRASAIQSTSYTESDNQEAPVNIPDSQLHDEAKSPEGSKQMSSTVKKAKLFAIPQTLTDLEPEVCSKVKKYESTFRFFKDNDKMSYAQSLYFYAWLKENNKDQKLTGMSFSFFIFYVSIYSVSFYFLAI